MISGVNIVKPKQFSGKLVCILSNFRIDYGNFYLLFLEIFGQFRKHKIVSQCQKLTELASDVWAPSLDIVFTRNCNLLSLSSVSVLAELCHWIFLKKELQTN